MASRKSIDPVENIKQINGKITFVKSNRLSKYFQMQSNVNSQIILHGHGLWKILIHQMARYARKNHLTNLLPPRGMLEEWSLKHKQLKKGIARVLYQNKDLANATVIHATSFKEYETIRKLNFTNPVAIIPNGIKINEFDETIVRKKQVLFLSRIVKNKGIEELISAWIKLPVELTKSWELKVVGEGLIIKYYTSFKKQKPI